MDTIALVNRMKFTEEMKSFNDEFNNCKYSVPNCKTTILCCDRYDDPASTKDYTRQSWAAAAKKISKASKKKLKMKHEEKILSPELEFPKSDEFKLFLSHPQKNTRFLKFVKTVETEKKCPQIAYWML